MLRYDFSPLQVDFELRTNIRRHRFLDENAQPEWDKNENENK